MDEWVRALTPPVVSAVCHSLWLASLFAGLFAIGRPWLRSASAEYAGAFLCVCASIAGFVAVFLLTCLGPVSGSHELYAARPPTAIWPGYVAIVWVVGATASSARFAGGWLWLQLVVMNESRAVPDELVAVFHQARRQLSVTPRAIIRTSDKIRTPMAAGVFRPMVLLPVSLLSGLPAHVMHAAIVHELAHIRRLDHLAVFLQVVGESLLFFHPAFRWLSAETRRLREFRCDEDSIQILGSRRDYALSLLTLEEERNRALPAISMNDGELMTRVKRIFGTQPNQCQRSLAGLIAIATIAAAGVAYPLAFSGNATAEERVTDESKLSISWLPESVTRWRSEISAAAKEHGVSADLLAIVMLIESRGKPNAVSPNGARGLMQIMPKTATEIAAARGLDSFDAASLTEPTVNVDFAAWYLGQQLARYAPESADDPTLLAVSAYNAGPKAVDAFLQGRAVLPEETQRYREIFSSLWEERAAADSNVIKR